MYVCVCVCTICVYVSIQRLAFGTLCIDCKAYLDYGITNILHPLYHKLGTIIMNYVVVVVVFSHIFRIYNTF